MKNKTGKRQMRWIAAVLFLALGVSARAEEQKGAPAGDSMAAAQAEKEKALKNPYPNDFGPGGLDVSKYEPALQEGYKLVQEKCSRCHSASRVLNSQFLELSKEETAALKAKSPELFREKFVWQIEPGIWQRYVRRMMAKPGCSISGEEGKKIWRFVAEDSKKRKTGASAKSWGVQRKKLLADFKASHPEKYKELFGE